ncbi:PIG-L family deacetylase [Patescibacteria group bacterium]|nr:PIG-L family deacetylase [Patescibacteria group bacterium]
MKILLLLSHPDDEVIMCGATIDKLVSAGNQVFVTFYTRNDQAYFGEEKQEVRRKRAEIEAKKCSRYLKYSLNFLNFQDMQVEADKGLLIQETINEIRRVKPDIIITHNQNDKHIDHRTISRIVPEANFQSGCNLCGGNTIWTAQAVLHGEIDLEMTSLFDFNIVSEISKKNLQKKIKAFLLYASVNNEHKTGQRWLTEKLEICAKLRGKAIGTEYGEAFILDNYKPLDSNALQLMAKLLKLI